MIKYIPFLFLLIACSQSQLPSIPLHSNIAVDSDFSEKDMLNIIDGIHQWEIATNGMVQANLIITDEPEMYGNDTAKIVNNFTDVDESSKEWTLMGLTHAAPSSTIIELFSNRIIRSGTNSKSVIMHEFGHALGLHHLTQGLMEPFTQNQICIDQDTLNEFCDFHNCDSNKIKQNCQ